MEKYIVCSSFYQNHTYAFFPVLKCDPDGGWYVYDMYEIYIGDTVWCDDTQFGYDTYEVRTQDGEMEEKEYRPMPGWEVDYMDKNNLIWLEPCV